MGITFKAFVYKDLKTGISNASILSYLAIFLIVVFIVFTYLYETVFHVESNTFLLSLIFGLGMLMMITSWFYQFYDFEKIYSNQKGFLELGKNELIINYDEKIKYENLTAFDLFIDAYYDERINLSYKNPIEKRSLGISNFLSFEHKGITRKYNFKIENKSHLKVLERNVYQLVMNDKLINIDAKKAIKLIPEKYTKTKEYKEYVGKQLKLKKINCTEGLLLIGYKTYEEAQELKKKYC